MDPRRNYGDAMSTIYLRFGATLEGISLDLQVGISHEALESAGASASAESWPSGTPIALSDFDLTRLSSRMPELLFQGLQVQQQNLALETQRILHERLQELRDDSEKNRAA